MAAATKPPTPARHTAAEVDAMYQPVRTRRGFDAVADQIRRQVSEGVLLAGQRLPGERELAEEFSISRSAVRQALRSLEHAGVVEPRTGINGGFFIKSSGFDGIAQAVQDMVGLGQVPPSEVMEARIELTNVAIRLACQRATDAELDAIGADIALHAELFRKGEGSRNMESVGEFYRLLARATHNKVVEMLIGAMSEIVRTLMARIDPKPHQDMIKARTEVLKHLRARDAERACAAMTRHLRQVSTYLESQARAR